MGHFKPIDTDAEFIEEFVRGKVCGFGWADARFLLSEEASGYEGFEDGAAVGACYGCGLGGGGCAAVAPPGDG